MFTGLIEDIGAVVARSDRAEACELGIRPRTMAAAELALGESVAIDGCCLTVIERSAAGFRVLMAAETLARTTLGDLRVGDSVNLERAMVASARFGGHMVSGHVDATATISAQTEVGPSRAFAFAAPAQVMRYVVEKGSIAVDGISLTVNHVDGYSFGVMLIPHTLAHTTLGAKRVGARVNLEVDVMAKYVEKLALPYGSGK